MAANWWDQGADGIQAFNWNYGENFPYAGQDWPSHLQAYGEFGSPELLTGLDKTFVVERRGGGHGPTVIPNPEDWSTPRCWYANTNLKAQLPAPLDNEGKADTLLKLHVADSLAQSDGARARLRLLLSDAGAAELPDDQRLDPVLVATIGHPKPGLTNTPPARQTAAAIQVRVNNILLPPATVEGGWLVFDVEPRAFAVGDNLVGVSVSDRESSTEPILVEKLEVEVKYGGVK